jgi:diaminopimelate decarboxylase
MDRIDLFPISTKIEADNLTLAGHDLASLADLYGTPLYVYDRATLNFSAQSYADALSTHYPASSHITYAGKAFLCKAIAQWTQLHKLYVDCTGQGEIGIAVAGGVPLEHILVHGVNKSLDDLKAAIEYAGTIVVDNLSELHNLTSNKLLSDLRKQNASLQIWLRLLPGVAVSTHHAHTQTGQH